MDFSAYFDYLSAQFESPELFVKRVLFTLGILLAISVISHLLTRWIRHVMESPQQANRIIRLKRLIGVALGIYAVLRVWSSHMNSLALVIAFVAFFSILALRGMVLDIVAFVYSSLRKQINIGDRIAIAGKIGDVIDMDIFQIQLMEVGELLSSEQGTGRSLMIPNRMLFDHMVVNYSFNSPFIRQDVRVLVDFDCDRQLAMQIAGKVAYRRHELIMADYDQEALAHFDRSLQLTDSDSRPQIRCELAANGYEIVVTYFSEYHTAAANKSLMALDLYDALTSRGFVVPTPSYVRVAP